MSEVELWNELGNLYTTIQAYDKAIQAYRKAIQLDGQCAQPYILLASTYAHLGRCAEAIPLFQRAIELVDDIAEKASLWNQLGDAYHRINDFNNAVEAYRMADMLQPPLCIQSFSPPMEEAPLPDPLLENNISIQGGILIEDDLSYESALPPKNTPDEKDAPSLMQRVPPQPAEEDGAPSAVGQPSAFPAPEPATPIEAVEPPSPPAESLAEHDAPPPADPTAADALNEPPVSPVLTEEICSQEICAESEAPLPHQQTGQSPQETVEKCEEPTASHTEPVTEEVAIPAPSAEQEPQPAGMEAANAESQLLPEAQSAQETASDGLTLEEKSPSAEEETPLPAPPAEAQTSPNAEPVCAAVKTDIPADDLGSEELPSSPAPATQEEPETKETLPTAKAPRSNKDKKAAKAPIFLGRPILSRPSSPSRASRRRGSAEDPRQLLAAGILCWRRGEFETALELLKDALEAANVLRDVPLKAICLNAMARVEIDLGKIDKAIQTYEHATELAPDQVHLWNSLGELYSKLGRYQKALEAFKKAIKHDPKNAASWNHLGDIYYKLGRQTDSIAAYQLGNVLERGAVHEDRLAMSPEFLHPDPFPEASVKEMEEIHAESFSSENLTAEESKEEKPSAQAEMDSGGRQNADLAAEAARQEAAAAGEGAGQPSAAEGAPLNEPALGPSAGHADHKAQPESAYWVFPSPPSPRMASNAAQPTETDTEVLTLPQLAPAFVVNVAPSPLETEETKKEEQEFISAAVACAEEAPAAEKKTAEEAAEAETALLMEEPEPAADEVPAPSILVEPEAERRSREMNLLENDIAAYRRVTEINPSNDRAWDALGNMLLEANRPEEALSAFERAIALAPRKEAYHYHLGLAYAAQKRYEEAIGALQKVVELSPQNVLARCTLARYSRRLGRDAEAQEHLAVARPAMKDENEYNRACFEAICGNSEEALALLRIALAKRQIQVNWMLHDPDLDFIRDDPRFKALLAESKEMEQAVE